MVGFADELDVGAGCGGGGGDGGGIAEVVVDKMIDGF
jgi:hypothetical protein